MEHIFYLFNQSPLFLIRLIISTIHTSQVIMKKANIIYFHNITKFNLTSFLLQIPETHFHPNLISKIPCSKGPNLPVFPSILLKKRKCFYGSFQKVCAQFHPFPPVHFCDLSTKTQKKLFESHFISKFPVCLPPGCLPPVFGGWGWGTKIPLCSPRLAVSSQPLVAPLISNQPLPVSSPVTPVPGLLAGRYGMSLHLDAPLTAGQLLWEAGRSKLNIHHAQAIGLPLQKSVTLPGLLAYN
jgi:hypothetical protein